MESLQRALDNDTYPTAKPRKHYSKILYISNPKQLSYYQKDYGKKNKDELIHNEALINKDEFDEEQNQRCHRLHTYHVFLYKVEATCTNITQLMSLFYEYAASAAMVKTWNHNTNSSHTIPNIGQITVIAFDTHIFALAML